MKKFTKKILRLLLCIIIVFPIMTACVDNSKVLTFDSFELNNGQVGIEYFASVAVAKGSEEVAYALKMGSLLPPGLTFSSDGSITGTPRTKGESYNFKIVASAEGFNDVETDFVIKILEGELKYEDADYKIAENTECDISIATASGAVGSVVYTKESGDLPDGVTLSSDGKIKGTPTAKGSFVFVVEASSVDCKPATAEITINVVLQWIEYKGRTLDNARKDRFYVADIGTATGPNFKEDITYFFAGGTLPDGLEFDSFTALVIGTPKETGKFNFKIKASAANFTDTEAEFVLTVQAASSGQETPGEITFVGGEIEQKAYSGVVFKSVKAVDKASVNNRQIITYTAAGLPDGYKMYLDGTLAGVTSKAGVYTLAVTATAAGCDSVTVNFTFTVLERPIVFNSRQLKNATAGETYSETVDYAKAADDPVITYTIVGGALPAGLSFNSATNMIQGTPTKPVKLAYIIVKAAADGYASITAEIYIRVQSAVVVTNKFEAEYVNLEGKSGSGYSNSASEEGMIQKYTQSSNGYILGYLHTSVCIAFTFTSTEAISNAKLILGMGTEIGGFLFSTADFQIRVNNVAVSFSSFNLTDSGGTYGNFIAYTISNNISLKKGENIIEFEVFNNVLWDGRAGGPGLDYLELQNTGAASISWRPYTYNLDRFSS